MALVRAARAPGPDRVYRHAVVLDEPLLHHDVRLGGDEVRAVVTEHVQRRRGERVAHLEEPPPEHAARAVALHEPAAAASASMSVDELPVPPRARGERIGLARGRIMQHRDLVDRAVHRARLHAHDEGHHRTRKGRHLRDIEARARRGIEREELSGLSRGGREVHVLDSSLGRAIIVEGLTERRAGGRREVLRLAHERLFVRPGDDRAGYRVARHLNRGGSIPGHGFDLALPIGEASNEPEERSVTGGLEARGHVLAVRSHLDFRGVHVTPEVDPEEDVAARDQVRPGRYRFQT